MNRRFLKFDSESPPHTAFSLGNPVHDGKKPPSRLTRGVLVNGEPVVFADNTLTERISHALRIGRELERKKKINDCVSFAALMSGLDLSDINASVSSYFDFVEDVDTNACIDPGDKTIATPVNIGIKNRRTDDALRFVHTIYPAHTTEGALYIHKLGDVGPLCLSGLNDAMKMYGCTIAAPVTKLQLA